MIQRLGKKHVYTLRYASPVEGNDFLSIVDVMIINEITPFLD
jgi:hypothetical protein